MFYEMFILEIFSLTKVSQKSPKSPKSLPKYQPKEKVLKIKIYKLIVDPCIDCL